MVGYYISMRLKQFWRFFSFNQVNPFIGIIVLPVIFVILSLLLFEKAPYPAWIYTAMAIVSILELQAASSNSFLKEHVNSSTYYRAKLAENILLMLPFTILLIAKNGFVQAGLTIAFVIPYSLYNVKLPKPKLKALKSPYLPYAIEWHNSFRSFVSVYILHLLLLIPGVISGNFYVYLVPFFLLLFFMNTTYAVVEDKFFIWVYRTSARQFLARKLKALAAGYALSFVLFAVVGAVFYAQHIVLLLLCLFAGFVAMAGSLIIKYHFYPGEFVIQLSQMLFLGFVLGGLVSPPLFIVALLIIIFSFFKAKKNLKTILQC